MNKTAVVFIHGFTGGEETWTNESKTSFSTMLSELEEFNELGFFSFNYHTKIVNMKNSSAAKVVSKVLRGILPKKYSSNNQIIKKNAPISEIAQMLITFIRCEVYDYSNIVFICHSMGGLVAKRAIVEVIDNDLEFDHEIIGYCSLATPHKGVIPSYLLSPFNINAKEMTPLQQENETLNDRWVALSDRIGKTLYVRAKSDELVRIVSSTPNSDIKKFPTEVIEADHTSICKPKNKDDLTFKLVRKFLVGCLDNSSLYFISAEDFERESSSYDKEAFVIKMILAEVSDLLLGDAKECFFHSEIIEKKAPKGDRKKIVELTGRIVSAYKTVAGSDIKRTSSELVGAVHEKIMDTDKQALDCTLKYINFMHKKGFLHKVSNQKNLDINWSKSVSIEDIERHQEEIND